MAARRTAVSDRIARGIAAAVWGWLGALVVTLGWVLAIALAPAWTWVARIVWKASRSGAAEWPWTRFRTPHSRSGPWWRS